MKTSPYPKSVRLRTRRQFRRMARHATRHVGYWIIVESRLNHQDITRLGITVTRKFGKANQRNRFKRIVREAFRLCRIRLKRGFDLNVKPRSAACEAKTADILNELMGLFGQGI